jgi:uncharacterized protein (TIGR02246 family)
MFFMKTIILTLLIVTVSTSACAQTAADKEAVNNAVTSFFNSWKNHDFSDMGNYTTKDVYWINPVGMLWNGQKDVQSSFTGMHQTFLKNHSLTVEAQDTRFLAPNVALVNVLFKSGAFIPPNSVDNGNNKTEAARGYQNMTVIKQNNKWLIASGQVTSLDEQLVKTDPLNHPLK